MAAGRANPLMDRKVVGAMFFGVAAMVWSPGRSPHPQLLDVVWCSAAVIVEGSLEVKLPTIWRDEKAVSREKSQKRKDQKKEDAGARKGRKVAKHCVFPESACEGFFVKKQPLYYIFTPSHLLI